MKIINQIMLEKQSFGNDWRLLRKIKISMKKKDDWNKEDEITIVKWNICK